MVKGPTATIAVLASEKILLGGPSSIEVGQTWTGSGVDSAGPGQSLTAYVDTGTGTGFGPFTTGPSGAFQFTHIFTVAAVHTIWVVNDATGVPSAALSVNVVPATTETITLLGASTVALGATWNGGGIDSLGAGESITIYVDEGTGTGFGPYVTTAGGDYTFTHIFTSRGTHPIWAQNNATGVSSLVKNVTVT